MPKTDDMKYFSLFTGVGGFELGIQNAYEDNCLSRATTDGEDNTKDNLPDPESRNEERRQRATCVGFSEIDKYASAVLSYQFPNVKNYGDISQIDWTAVPDFDLLVGGSPCQDFSIAGKRAGLVGVRSGLFGQYVRALEEKKPAHFIWENVKGVLSSNEGRDFAVILNTLAEAGYSLQWQILNAKDFGVPQNRERVFVIGTRGNGGREVFFKAGADTKSLVEITQNAPDAERVYNPSGIGRTLKGLGGGEGAKTMLIRCPLRYLDRNQKNIEGDYAFTVDASQTAGATDGVRVRRLTPTECERLMGWPDSWTKYGNFDGETKEISDSQRYKMCGNGVVSAVVEQIIKQCVL